MTAIAPVSPPPLPSSTGFSIAKVFVISAVAVAVVGLAAAILTNQTFAAIGYALLGIYTGGLWFWGSANFRVLGQIEDTMQKDVLALQNANKQTENLTGQLAKEDSTMKQNAASLQQVVDGLRSQNQQLQNSLKTMDGQLQKFNKENQTLNTAKAGLEKDLNALQSSYQSLQAQVQQFLSLNLQMGQNVGAFTQADGDLAKTSQDLTGALAKLQQAQGDFSQLGSQIELGRKSVQQILSYVSAQEQREKQELDQLRSTVNDLQASQKGLASQTAALAEQRKAIEARAQQLDLQSKQLSDTQASIGQQEDAIKQSIQQLSVQKDGIAADLKKVQDANAALQANEQRALKSAQDLDQRIAKKQKQIADLDTIIRQKLDQLNKLKA